MHKWSTVATLLAAAGCARAFINDIFLLDGRSSYDISCTDLSHAVCVYSECPLGSLALEPQTIEEVCLNFNNQTCVQPNAFYWQLETTCSGLIPLELNDETPISTADGHFFYSDGYPELESSLLLRLSRLLFDAEDLQFSQSCDSVPTVCALSVEELYTDAYHPSLANPTFSTFGVIASLLETDAGKSYGAAVSVLLDVYAETEALNAARAVSRMPVKYVFIFTDGAFYENYDLFVELQDLYQTYGIAVVIKPALDDVLQSDANDVLKSLLAGSSNLVINIPQETEYGPFCGTTEMHSLVSNITTNSVAFSSIVIDIAQAPNVMPNCNWTDQNSMRVVGSMFLSDYNDEYSLFDVLHPEFGNFPDIELFTMFVAEPAGTFELGPAFAVNGKLTEMIMNFYLPYHRTFPSVFWTANLDSLVVLELQNYAGIVLGDLLDYGQNFKTLTINYAHVQFRNASSINKLQVVFPASAFDSRIQCLDEFSLTPSVICIPGDIFTDPLNYTNPEFLSVFENAVQHNFSSTYLSLHQQYLPTVNDVATIEDARGAALLAHVQRSLTRSFADVDLVGGFAAFNENTTNMFHYAAESMGYPLFNNVRVLNVDANTDNIGGTLITLLRDSDWHMPVGSVFLNITVSTPIQYFDAIIGKELAYLEGLSIHGSSSLFTGADDQSSFTNFFVSVGKHSSRLKLLELHNQVYDGAFWGTNSIASHNSLIALIMSNVTIPSLDGYFSSTGTVVSLRSVIMDSMNVNTFPFPNDLFVWAPALQTLIIKNSNLTGTINESWSANARSLTNFDVSNNPLLGGTLSDSFLALEFSSVFDIHNTNIAISATADMPLCRSEPGFVCILSLASTVGPGCSCLQL